jgi:hypothetical protein
MINIDYSLTGAVASIKAARIKPTKGKTVKTMTPRRDYTPPGGDGLDQYRKTGGERRWGKGICQADYAMLSIGKKMARATAMKAGKPWPPPIAPTRREQFRDWARVGQQLIAKIAK